MSEHPKDAEPEVDPSEMGNYEGVAGGDTTAQSGDPNAEAAKQASEDGELEGGE